jgi:hypothetical protein
VKMSNEHNEQQFDLIAADLVSGYFELCLCVCV